MTRYFVSALIVSTWIFLITTTEACGSNEVAKEDINGISDCCPEPKDQPSRCPDSHASPCKCAIHFLRAANGTCISARNCPAIPCGENEAFDSCPVCSEQCDNASADGRRCRFVGRVGITVICQPACRCVDNYWRDKSNNCVPYNQCPQFQTG